MPIGNKININKDGEININELYSIISKGNINNLMWYHCSVNNYVYCVYAHEGFMICEYISVGQPSLSKREDILKDCIYVEVKEMCNKERFLKELSILLRSEKILKIKQKIFCRLNK